MPRAPQDIYARQLLSPRGYPLWTPEPSNEFLMERRDGLRIGDVGVVLDDGGFDVLFNICLPEDHSFHRRRGVPKGFTYTDPDRLDIGTNPNAECPCSIISSSSVTRVALSEPSIDASTKDDPDPPPYKFNLSSSEGALLILPKGAVRYNLLNEDVFLEQACRHGAEWYDYAVNTRRRIIGPDSLYLITGVCKTRSWSVAAFGNAPEGERHTAYFKQIERAGAEPTYRWETTCASDWHVGPHIDQGIPNQAVFIRGLKIAIRDSFLGTRKVSVRADSPSPRSSPVKAPSILPGKSPILGSLAGFLGRRGSGVFQTTRCDGGKTDPIEGSPQSNVPDDDSMRVEVQRIPDVPPAFHPSDAINQYLLDMDPSANIAVTHDSHWISLLEDGSLTVEELGQGCCLEKELSRDYRVVSREGAVYLERRLVEPMDAHPPPTSESEAIAPVTSGFSTGPVDPLGGGVDPPFEGGSKEMYVPGWNGDGLIPPLIHPTLDLFTLHAPAPHFQVHQAPLDSVTGCQDLFEPLIMMHQLPSMLVAPLGQAPEDLQSDDLIWPIAGDPLGSRQWPPNFPGPIASVRSHLRATHGFYNTSPTRCEWNNCGREISRRSMARHVQEVHLCGARVPMRTENLRHGGRDSRQCHCRWMTNGRPCNALVLEQEMCRHIQIAHHLDDTMINCSRDGCMPGGRRLDRGESFVRHIRDRLLERRWACPTCDAVFAHRGAMDAHHATCPGRH